MGMSTYVLGFKPPDETFYKMKAAYEACEEAGVDIPEEVNEYFEDERPDDAGVSVMIPHEEWSDDSSEGIEVDIEKLPPGVKVIRFVNAW